MCVCVSACIIWDPVMYLVGVFLCVSVCLLLYILTSGSIQAQRKKQTIQKTKQIL